MTDYRSRFWLNLAIAVMGLAAFALVPMLFNRGIIFLAGLVAINVVFALSWNLLFSGIGLLSFGQAMFFAGGSYMMAVLSLKMPAMPFLLALAIGAGTGGAIAFIFGFIALKRASGTYFAILTLAFAEFIHIIITKTNFLGRNDGLVGVRRPAIDLAVFELNLATGNSYYYFIIVTMSLAAFALWCLQNSPAGRLMQAIRQEPMRAAFLGADIQTWRLVAFIISGFSAGFAGAVFAPWAQIVSPEIAHWSVSTQPILFALLGGTGSFWGPALGAILFGAVDYGTRNLQGLSELTVGILLLAVVLAIPGGILGLLSRAAARSKPNPVALPRAAQSLNRKSFKRAEKTS
jgi:branched-chain amino acid transport system permease protein